QSYFLFELGQAQLARAEFPVGELTKARVRGIARELDLPVAEKPESQDICFVPGGDYRAVVQRERGDLGTAGGFVDRGGRVLGGHGGVGGYTVGQRRGLRIAGGNRLYVLELRAASGTVVLGEETELVAEGLRASGWKWVSGEAPAGPIAGRLRIRHRHAGAE